MKVVNIVNYLTTPVNYFSFKLIAIRKISNNNSFSKILTVIIYSFYCKVRILTILMKIMLAKFWRNSKNWGNGVINWFLFLTNFARLVIASHPLLPLARLVSHSAWLENNQNNRVTAFHWRERSGWRCRTAISCIKHPNHTGLRVIGIWLLGLL